MQFDQALAFLVFALAAAITPGPSNTMIVATGAAAGIRRGLPCALGAAAGMGCLLFCSALGLGELVTAEPMLLKALNIGGAIFLLWLAWKIATSGPASISAASEPVGFWGAAMFQWVNPKGWLVAVSATGTYLQAATGSAITQALWFGSLFFAAALPAGLVWLVLGAAIQPFLRDEHRARIFNVTMGAALALSVVAMWV